MTARRGEEGVSAVTGVLLMAAVTVVLATVVFLAAQAPPPPPPTFLGFAPDGDGVVVVAVPAGDGLAWGDEATAGIVPSCGAGTTMLRSDGAAVSPGDLVLPGDRITGCDARLVVVDTAAGRVVYRAAA